MIIKKLSISKVKDEKINIPADAVRIAKMKNRFLKWQKDHPNFITPNLVEIKEIRGRIVELSKGTGFNGETVYGVSVIKETLKGFESSEYLGRCFNSLNNFELAKNYFNEFN